MGFDLTPSPALPTESTKRRSKVDRPKRHICCGCFDPYRGTLFSLVINFAVATFTLIFGGTHISSQKPPASNLMGVILMLISVCSCVISIYGWTKIQARDIEALKVKFLHMLWIIEIIHFIFHFGLQYHYTVFLMHGLWILSFTWISLYYSRRLESEINDEIGTASLGPSKLPI
jgi:hypothetical protein